MLGGLKKSVKAFLKQKKREALRKNVVNAHHDVSRFDASKVFDARKYGFNLAESASYKLTEDTWRDYISTWESYQPRLQNTEYSLISDDKLLFSQVIGNVAEVPKNYGLVVNGTVEAVEEAGLTGENLYGFLAANGGGVLKPRIGYDGFGIHIFTADENGLLEDGKPVSREEFNTIISGLKDSLIQNRVRQGAFEAGIFDKSVNTIRVISIKRKDANEHEIVGAVQRFGTNRSAPVDNFSQGGGSALIDISTGRLSAMTCMDSVDENGERIFYAKHPDSGAQIEGQVIPHWEQVKSAIVEITRKCPYFNFVAWDVVVKDEGIAIIEMNMKSSLRVFQVHGGMRNALLGQKYKEYGYITD